MPSGLRGQDALSTPRGGGREKRGVKNRGYCFRKNWGGGRGGTELFPVEEGTKGYKPIEEKMEDVPAGRALVAPY